MGGVYFFNYANSSGYSLLDTIIPGSGTFLKNVIGGIHESGLSDALESYFETNINKNGEVCDISEARDRNGQVKTQIEGSWFEYVIIGLIVLGAGTMLVRGRT